MAYRSGNFSYVADSSFNPYQSLQEMLIPFNAYKEAFEKRAELNAELHDKADMYKYLEDKLKDNPNSKAAKIYNKFSSDLEKYSEDFSKHGLNIANGKGFLRLRQRVSGEIGRLAKADANMEEERKLRRTNPDTSMLYATDNLDIDQFLDGETPNLYKISGEDLRKEGAQYALAASSRIYNSTSVRDVTKYFQEIIQEQGYSPKVMEAFRQSLEAIPEFQRAVRDIMDARGVSKNLSGDNLRRAERNIVNGIMEGSLYKQERSLQRNPGVLDAKEAASVAQGWAHVAQGWAQIQDQRNERALNRQMSGITVNKDGTVSYDPNKDISLQQKLKVAEAKGNNKKGGAAEYSMKNKKPIMVGTNTGRFYKAEGDDNSLGREIENAIPNALDATQYAQLVNSAGEFNNPYLKNITGNGSLSDYEVAIIPSDITGEDEDIIMLSPRTSGRTESGSSESGGGYGGYGNGSEDVPNM